MTALTIDKSSAARLQANLDILPRRIGLRVLRIALNAFGGVVKKVQKARARRQTGLLAKSPTVKVKIPDASYNAKHHGKPAYVIIGPSRGVVGAVAGSKLLSARKATKRVLGGGTVQTRRPSRYAHLVERIDPFVGPSVEAGRTAGMAAMAQKLEQGIAAEAAKLTK